MKIKNTKQNHIEKAVVSSVIDIDNKELYHVRSFYKRFNKNVIVYIVKEKLWDIEIIEI